MQAFPFLHVMLCDGVLTAAYTQRRDEVSRWLLLYEITACACVACVHKDELRVSYGIAKKAWRHLSAAGNAPLHPRTSGLAYFQS